MQSYRPPPDFRSVTRVAHAAVSHEIDWYNQMKVRMDGIHSPILSLDTESVHLGIIEHSIVCFQFAEVFHEGFLHDQTISRPISINMKPGFMILFPYRANVLAALSAVLSHSNIFIIMLDCTSDLCAMTEAGIGKATSRFIQMPLSLKNTIHRVRLASESQKAMQALKYKGSANFDLIT